MSQFTQFISVIKQWLKKSWLQWLIAAIIFFLFSWLYMGSGINSCTSYSVPGLGSDSTGGMAWNQWAGGNDFSWGYTHKSNYPVGEQLDKPQYVTSTIFLSIYKLFASLTTPICGLNLIVLLGYLSTALTMFGLIKWLLKRFDIALFAGYAAAFVPFHILKSQSHVNYIYGSIFIGLVFAFLWLLSKPSYRRAFVFAAVSSIGFYFDGYFILISGLLISGLIGSQVLVEAHTVITHHSESSAFLRQLLRKLKYNIVSVVFLGLLLLPILFVYHTKGSEISKSLSSVRSDIKTETLIYGARPIELFLPAASNPLMPATYGAWRAQKLHGSNFSESTLYAGYTVLILAAVALVALAYKKRRNLLLKNIRYSNLVFMVTVTLLLCAIFSLPAYAYLFGHAIRTPTSLLVELTANWRVLSRLFLAIDPLLILLASLGLYWITKNKSWWAKSIIVAACGLLLFFEYLPNPINTASNITKDTPLIYKQLASDKAVNLVAEYPLADFSYTPGIFTFQQIHNKTLLNANDGGTSKGPFDSSIAGLNDEQTIGALKSLGVDEIITHGFESNNPLLNVVYKNQIFDSQKNLNILASSYAYKLNELVGTRPVILVVRSGYESQYVDAGQISHRYVTSQAIMGLHHFTKANKDGYGVSFSAVSVCKNSAQISITQAGLLIWAGSVGEQLTPISFNIKDQDFTVQTSACSIEISHLFAT